MKFNYYNPVKIIFGMGSLQELSFLIGRRNALLLTSPVFEKNKMAQKIISSTPQIKKVISSVKPNPVFEDLKEMYQDVYSASEQIDIIVALGGGSVLDSAKVLSVYNISQKFDFVEELIREKAEKKNYQLLPIIAVPTTAGTGSEVTPWATVWDDRDKKKYSLHLNNLWPETALLDAELTLSLPEELTISTGLDALSHSLESLWNKNRNPVSTLFAMEAAKEILEVLPALKKDLKNISLREKMLLASLKAGLAFSNTKTALAHAISYYLTSNYGVSHGLACSFSLPDILSCLPEEDQELTQVIQEIFGKTPCQKLKSLFHQLNISHKPQDYGLTQKDLLTIEQGLNQVSRAGNSLVDAEKLFKKWK